jgi:RNA polymerase sigma-70 factor (ECF subfamily)
METQRTDSLGQRFADGDQRAVKEVYDRFAGQLASVAFRVLGDRELAAEAVQQALVQAWLASTHYDPRRPLGPWLVAITRRAAFDVHRRLRYRHRAVPLDVDELDSRHYVDDAPEQVWTRWKVRAAIRTLSAADQAVVTLAFLHDLTHREVAERLGIPIGTVKSRLFRAQRKLVHLLGHLRSTDDELAAA